MITPIGMLGDPDDVPDTIGQDESERLRKAGARLPWFTREACERRVAGMEQSQKRLWS